MKLPTLTTLTVLTVIAAYANVSWAASQTVLAPESTIDPCQQGSGAGSALPAPEVKMAGGCTDCILIDVQEQTYCESRGSDCDGWLGWNESYKWDRDLYIYECGTQGLPGHGWYVECVSWNQDGCCNNGSEGLPPLPCTYEGAANCATRAGGPGSG